MWPGGYHAPVQPRVAVTGAGILTRFGGLGETWAAALAGRDGAVELAGPAWEGSRLRRAAALGPAAAQGFHDPRFRRLDRTARFALAAAADAWSDAGASVVEVPPDRRAVLLGTSRGCVESVEKTLLDPEARRSPFDTLHTLPSSPASAVSIALDCRGASIGLTSACASAAQAIGLGARLIQAGSADLVVAGGSEACITPWYAAMAQRSGILSPDVCRPFDLRRNGTLLGEGAGLLILEPWERAVARGARIRGELLGFGMSSDARSLHAPGAEGEAMAAALLEALREGGVAPERIRWVKAHGTGTLKGDEAEARAILAALGGEVPVGSLKPVVGHTLGASAGIEGALVLAALEARQLPPTANLEQPDPALGLNFSGGGALDGPVVVNAAGFGGTNACLVLGPPP